MGTRSTASKYGFDRYWRDLRTFTLHDPVDYKLRDIGNWILNQELPPVTQYS
jgi:alkylation response protein AidB-like acyl-CoA dehydrogenase